MTNAARLLRIADPLGEVGRSSAAADRMFHEALALAGDLPPLAEIDPGDGEGANLLIRGATQGFD